MSELLGNLAGWFGSPAGKGLGELAGLGATGAGLVGNLVTDKQRADAAKLAEANAKLTPQQLGAMVSGATQPLNQGLVQAVTNTTNANLAEQGLSEAPGLIATATSQALAPFEQQNQNTALQLVMQKLGLPAEFARTIPPNANMAPLLALLMKGFGSGSSPSTLPPFTTTGPTPEQAGSDTWNWGDWNLPSDTTGVNA